MSETDAQTVAFVRETMVPPSEPPGSETGAVHWLRENLFSTWLNAILTIHPGAGGTEEIASLHVCSHEGVEAEG